MGVCQSQTGVKTSANNMAGGDLTPLGKNVLSTSLN